MPTAPIPSPPYIQGEAVGSNALRAIFGMGRGHAIYIAQCLKFSPDLTVLSLYTGGGGGSPGH